MQHSRGIKGEGWARGRKDEREAQNETWTLGCLNTQSICKTINQAFKIVGGREREEREKRESERAARRPSYPCGYNVDRYRSSAERMVNHQVDHTWETEKRVCC